MDTIVMNTSECDIKHEAPMDEEYGVEVMCAGWNPLLTLVGEISVDPTNRHVNLPADLAISDVDAFLKKMYELQR
jgi:hypothetical protein